MSLWRGYFLEPIFLHINFYTKNFTFFTPFFSHQILKFRKQVFWCNKLVYKNDVKKVDPFVKCVDKFREIGLGTDGNHELKYPTIKKKWKFPFLKFWQSKYFLKYASFTTLIPVIKSEFNIVLDHVLPIVNFSNGRRLPLPVTLSYDLHHLLKYFESEKRHIYILQKSPSGGIWSDATKTTDFKLNMKSMELRVKTKIISSMIICVATNPIDDDVIVQFPTVMLQANQGHALHMDISQRQSLK